MERGSSVERYIQVRVSGGSTKSKGLRRLLSDNSNAGGGECQRESAVGTCFHSFLGLKRVDS